MSQKLFANYVHSSVCQDCNSSTELQKLVQGIYVLKDNALPEPPAINKQERLAMSTLKLVTLLAHVLRACARDYIKKGNYSTIVRRHTMTKKPQTRKPWIIEARVQPSHELSGSLEDMTTACFEVTVNDDGKPCSNDNPSDLLSRSWSYPPEADTAAPLPVGGSETKPEFVSRSGQNAAPTPSRTQKRTQRLSVEDKTSLRSASSVFAEEHTNVKSFRCPSCAVRQGSDCVPVQNSRVRRRGRRWHHITRYVLALQHDPAHIVERAERAAMLHEAPTTPPRPCPSPPYSPQQHGLGPSAKAPLSEVLTDLPQNTSAQQIRAALRAVGPHLRYGSECWRLDE